jgi:hypothetical protein
MAVRFLMRDAPNRNRRRNTKSFSEEWEMSTRKHLHGVSDKEQREYEHIKESAQQSGRYGKRAKEVAARTVLKHHRQEGHKKGK